MNLSTDLFYIESPDVAFKEVSLAPWIHPSMKARHRTVGPNTHQKSERQIWARENNDFLEAYNARIERGEISFAEFRGL